MSSIPRDECMQMMEASNMSRPEIPALEWFSKYPEDKIQETSDYAISFLKAHRGTTDMSEGILHLTSTYELTEVEARQLLLHVRKKMWGELMGESIETSSEVANEPIDPSTLTERCVQIKSRSYRLGPILGKGGFGVVRLGVRQTENGELDYTKRYALKFISKDHMKSNIHFVKREIMCMKRVEHRNVLRLFRYGNVDYPHHDGQLDPSILLVTEYCPKGELFDIIFYCNGMPDKLARTYFRQLMSGLNAIHSADVFHRDIKPQNLLLNSNFELKICDFGLSNVWNRVDLLKTKVGTRGFMAPEMIMKFKYNAAVDIFSAGVVLFNMVCGACPFRNADPKEDMHYYRIATKDDKTWQRYPNVCQPLKDLVHGMLAYQPVDRMTMANIHANEWFQGEVFSPHELVQEMRVLHEGSLAAKGEEGTSENEDDSFLKTRALEDDMKPPPTLMEFEKLKYVTPFHTYAVEQDQVLICRAVLNKTMIQTVKHVKRDYKQNDDLWIYTARYEKKIKNPNPQCEKSQRVLKFEILIQFRFFQFEKDGPVYFTIFRSDESNGAERDLSKPFVHKLLANIEQYISPYVLDESDAELSADEFESDSEIDEEQVQLELERMQLEAQERENRQANKLANKKRQAKPASTKKREAKTVEEN